jgi:hypothetical protein
MLTLLKTGLVVLEELVLTPRGKDMCIPELGPMATSHQERIYHTSGILTTKL